MADTMWMVRAGESAYLADEFEKGYVAIGWQEIGDLTNVSDQEQIKERCLQAYPGEHPAKAANAAAMISKFRFRLTEGTRVVTYNSESRTYLVGDITGDYHYEYGVVKDYPPYRTVHWSGRVHRDKLSLSS